MRLATRLIIEERFPRAFAPVCLDDDFETGVAHLEFPLAHRRAVRTANLLERLFKEERRRTKVLRTPSASAVLKLTYVALIGAGDRWRGIRITAFEQRQLKVIRDKLDRAHTSPPVYPARTGRDQLRRLQ